MERQIPSALWVGIAALGVMTLITLLTGVRTGSDVLLAATILDTVLLAGLVLGHKWAYVGILVFAIGGPLAVLGRNPEQTILGLLLNSLVVVPVILSTRFFFPGPPASPGVGKPESQRP